MDTTGETWWRDGDKSGAWDEHTHTTIYEIDNQQGTQGTPLNILG